MAEVQGKVQGKGKGKGQKRPLEQTSEEQEKRKTQKKEQVSKLKEKKKGDNAEKREESKAVFDECLAEIAPCMASVVDTFGGVATVQLINNDAELQQLLENIPSGFPKLLKKLVSKIVEMFPEYIVQLQGGYIATALGYENQLVSADGVVDKDQVKESHAERDPTVRPTRDNVQAIHQRGPKGAGGGEKHTDPKNPKGRLFEVAKSLQKAASERDQRTFDVALKAVYAARTQVFGDIIDDNGFTVGGDSYDCEGSPQGAFLEEVRRIMVQDNDLKAGGAMKLIDITSKRSIKEAHARILSGTKKMSKLIESQSEWFELSKNTTPAGGCEMWVTISAAGVKHVPDW